MPCRPADGEAPAQPGLLRPAQAHRRLMARMGLRMQDYVARRIATGSSKLEAIRCLKRYIAREVFGILMRRHREINQSQIAA